MAIFSRNDRIAIAILCAVIIAGWGWRSIRQHRNGNEGIRVIRGAVTTPRALDPEVAPGDSAGVSSASEESPIDVNTADVAALESLPLIGASRAQAIVAWRTEHGPFHRVEDLLEVPGIGPGVLERIRDRVFISAISPPPH